MGEVVALPIAQPKAQPTKSVTHMHGGQRYTCRYDPNAPHDQRWVWIVDYVQTYRYVGSASSLEKATVGARKQIHILNKRIIEREEASSE